MKEETKNFYDSALDNLLEGFQIIGPDYRYLYLNKSAASQGKRRREELVGKRMWEEYPGIEKTDFFRHLESCMRDRQTHLMENLFTFPDGSQEWFELRMYPVPQGAAILSLNIHQRKIAQEKLLRLTQQLESRVEARTRELEDLNKELESFSYSVSHDLRAPLRHVQGFMDLLQERAQGRLDEQSLHYMSSILEAAKKMGMLIDDLLDFSRMGHIPLKKEMVRLEDMVHEIIRELSGQAGEKAPEWRVSGLPEAECDPSLMRQVFINLLSNAVKFTRMRECPQIEVGCMPDETEHVVVFVRDNGAGFDMAYSKKLFGVFQRLHSASEFEGTGIGLATVRRVVHRHGGRVWAEGKPEEGAVFYVSLPAQGGKQDGGH